MQDKDKELKNKPDKEDQGNHKGHDKGHGGGGDRKPHPSHALSYNVK